MQGVHHSPGKVKSSVIKDISHGQSVPRIPIHVSLVCNKHSIFLVADY